jgi:iron complex transport system ATP-binding protein
MMVTDYVLLGRTPYISYLGVETKRDIAIVESLLQRLDVGTLAARPLRSLSGGELQRVVIAHALAREAPILLLDEPTSALDVGHQQEVLELIDALRHQDGLTVLAAMHDLTLAAQFADRVVLLTGGRIVAEGPPAAVLTEHTISEHFGASVRVLHEPDGSLAIVPVRARHAKVSEDAS